MSTLTSTANAFVIAAGIASGCAANEPAAPGTGEPIATDTTIDSPEAAQHLEALRALDIVSVGRLLVALPSEATACYGLPCEGWESASAAEVARQMPRLQHLTTAAEAAVETSDATVAPGADEIAADLQKLRALYVVQLGDLIVEAPQASPNCYNLVCPDEQARVDAANRARAAALGKLAKDASGL